MIKPNSITESDCEEIWKPIPGFEGFYSVSNLGRIRRDAKGGNATYQGRILKPCPIKGKRYMRVCLAINGRHFHRKVHHLVMLAFVGTRPPNHQVDHLEAKPEDNRLGRLEYVTPEENRRRAKSLKRYPSGERNAKTRLTEGQVRELRSLAASGISMTTLAARYKVCPATVWNIVHKITWKYVI